MLALRTQQVLAHETGLAGKADPLGGAWWLERLTQDLATQALANVDQIFEAGGVAAALASGAIPSCRAEVTGPRRAKERGAGPSAAASRRAHLEAARRRRNAADVERCLALLAQAAASSANVMEPLIASARALATLGEMCDVLRSAGDAARREQLS
jgi:methylmalonyl-CoA mutase N-terminal domain/subunit